MREESRVVQIEGVFYSSSVDICIGSILPSVFTVEVNISLKSVRALTETVVL